RPHSVALRGVFRGFRKKSPKSDVVTVAILFTKGQNVRNLAVLKIDHRFKAPQRNPKGKRPNLRGGFILCYIILSGTVTPFRALKIKN
ncbi:hypothetical protein, partial [Gilliamella sp. Gris1-4]|uniref:hypothetical protein n=1 Tax=Gilliamella sp. Gris1-4 TaxID=3120244 RepID=UPI001C400EE5